MCHCHHDRPAVTGLTICRDCVEQRRTLCDVRADNGFCKRHGDVAAVPGKLYCQDCLNTRKGQG